jgi:hypothetical protein
MKPKFFQINKVNLFKAFKAFKVKPIARFSKSEFQDGVSFRCRVHVRAKQK